MKHSLIQSLYPLAMALALFAAAGCGGTQAGHGASEKSRFHTKDAVAARVNTAARLSRAGRHYDASLQLEAALGLGADEPRVLPRLAAAQIRAHRLRAAKRTLARLIRVAPSHPHTAPLLALLESMAPGGDESTAMGGPR